MTHKSRIDELGKRAHACGADENLRDAWSDLIRWPNLGKRIMDDLECVIESYEEEQHEDKSSSTTSISKR